MLEFEVIDLLQQHKIFYFIRCNSSFTMSGYNSGVLLMRRDEYDAILLECGADFDDGSRLGFSSKENAERALEQLLPYITMTKLLGVWE